MSVCVPSVDGSLLILNFLDILQGRSICRALWDYYKISGHIEGCEILSEEVKVSKLNFFETNNFCTVL